MCRPTKRPKPTAQFESAIPTTFESNGAFDLKPFPQFEAKPQTVPEVEVAPASSTSSGQNKQTFVYTTYEMVTNPENAQAVGFDSTGCLLQIRDAALFGEEVLPKYFRHKNVTSFYRQLNSYGFRTIKTSSVEVSHTFLCDLFRRDRPDLLSQIVRKKAAPPPAAIAAAKAQQARLAQQPAAVVAAAAPVVAAAPTSTSSNAAAQQASLMQLIHELQEFQRAQQARAEQLEANIRRLTSENKSILPEGELVIGSMQNMVNNQTQELEKILASKAAEMMFASNSTIASPEPIKDDIDVFAASNDLFGNDEVILPDDDLLELETLLAFEDDAFSF